MYYHNISIYLLTISCFQKSVISREFFITLSRLLRRPWYSILPRSPALISQHEILQPLAVSHLHDNYFLIERGVGGRGLDPRENISFFPVPSYSLSFIESTTLEPLVFKGLVKGRHFFKY